MSIQEKFNDDNKSIPMLLDENKIKQLIAESKDPFSYIYEISELMFDKANRLSESAKEIKSEANRLSESTKEIKSETNRLSESTKEIKSKVDRLSERVKLVESKVDRLSESVKLSESKADRLSERVKLGESKADRLSERVKLVESKVDRLNECVKVAKYKVDRLNECVKVAKYKVGRLDKCIKVVESKEISLSDTFVLLKRINCNNDEYMEYYVIYGKKNNVTATMRRKLKYGNMELVLSIDCSPNIKNLYHRVKERLSNKIETCGNSINLVNITQEEFCREISCINNEYKV